jgi:chromate transporter
MHLSGYLPSILIALPLFNKAIAGVIVSFVGLLLSVTVLFALKIPWDLWRTLLAVSALVALLLKVEIYWVVLAGVIISIILL